MSPSSVKACPWQVVFSRALATHSLLAASAGFVACSSSGSSSPAPTAVIESPATPSANTPAAPADAGTPLLGADASTPANVAAAAAEIPALLSQTGLYEADMVTLAADVRPFEPRFQLWSDAADKRRWIALPDGAQIDNSSMEYWSYPAGTRIYKEFSVAGVRVETRLLQRQENGAWWMMAYHWRDDQSDADAVPDGLPNASGTLHDIPSTDDCRTCHLRMPDKVIGFSAVELAHEVEPEDSRAWSLARLQAEGKLSQPTAELHVFPDDDLGRQALGYLHANCGFCHQPRSSVSSRVALSLWLRSDALSVVAQTPSYASSVGVEVDLSIEGPQGFPLIIDPGSPDTSALFLRMQARGIDYAMPPLASEQVDAEASQVLRQWITTLASDAGAPDGGASGTSAGALDAGVTP